MHFEQRICLIENQNKGKGSCLKIASKIIDQTFTHSLVVKALDSQSRGPKFKTNRWLQGQLSFASF